MLARHIGLLLFFVIWRVVYLEVTLTSYGSNGGAGGGDGSAGGGATVAAAVAGGGGGG